METKNNNNELPLEEQPVKEEKKKETAVVKKQTFTPELCANTINKILGDKDLAPLHNIAKVFAKPFESFRKAFKDPEEADRKLAREIDFAAQALMSNTYLITVATKNPVSLVNAIKNIALAGTTLNPVTKQAYLVPFTIKGQPTIVLFQSYMGEVSLLVNTGLVKKMEAHCVFEGDEFKVSHGTKEEIIHNPNCWGKRDESTLKGGYWYAVMTDGTEMFDFMNKEEIDKIMKRSPSTGVDKDGKQKSSPWVSDYTEMARKTLIHRGYKAIPKNNISEDKLKVLEAVFDYEEKAEQNWIAEQKASSKKSTSDFDEEEFTEYEEL